MTHITSIVTHALMINMFVIVSKAVQKRDSKSLTYFPNYVIYILK